MLKREDYVLFRVCLLNPSNLKNLEQILIIQSFLGYFDAFPFIVFTEYFYFFCRYLFAEVEPLL